MWQVIWRPCGPDTHAAWSGWEEGVQQLLRLGAKVNASNNAGDRPWHWARNMGHTGVMAILEQVGAGRGSVAAGNNASTVLPVRIAVRGCSAGDDGRGQRFRCQGSACVK